MSDDLRLIAAGGIYAETDPNNHLNAATATSLAATTLARNEKAYHYRPGTFSGSAYAEGTINISALAGATQPKDWLMGFTDGVGTYPDTVNGAQWRLYSADTTNHVADNFLTQSSAVTTGAGTGTGVLNTSYYWRGGFYSSLGGQYGALFFGLYSDSARVTQVTNSAITPRSANTAYSEFYAAASVYVATTGSITGTNNDITLFYPTAGEDQTGANSAEVDASSRIVRWPDVAVVTGLNQATNQNAATYTSLDGGAGAYADYKVSGVLCLTAYPAGAAVAKLFNILSFTNAAADALAATELQGIAIEWASATTYKPYLQENVSGTPAYSTAGPTLTLGWPYSFVLERSGSSVILKIFTDLVLENFSGNGQVGTTLTWTGRATTAYRYLMPVASSISGTTSRSATFTLGGIQFPPISKATISYTQASDVVSIQATLAKTATFSYTQGNDEVSISANLLFPPQVSLAYTQASDVVAMSLAQPQRASLSYTQGSDVVTIYADVQAIFEVFSWEAGAGDTGLTCTLEIRRQLDKKWRNFTTLTFETAGTTLAMTESNRALLYEATIDTSTFNGKYLFIITCAAAAAGKPQSFEQHYNSGVVTTGGLSFSDVQTLATLSQLVRDNPVATRGEMDANSTRLAAIAGYTDTLEASMAALPSAVLAAATTTPIAANMEQTNGTDLKGDGTTGDKFRSVLVA
ncbi:MAG: hypothetical protein WAW75_00130 [Gallionella sp.]